MTARCPLCDTPAMSSPQQFSVILTDGRRFGPATLDVLEQWAREGRVPRTAMIEPQDRSTPAKPVLSEPRLAAIISAPPTVAGDLSAPADDGVSTLIPYKNGHALGAYYIGILSLLPVLGIILAPIAIIMGIIGIRRYRENPRIKGVVHGWIGVVLGLIGLLISAVIIGGIIFAAVAGP